MRLSRGGLQLFGLFRPWVRGLGPWVHGAGRGGLRLGPGLGRRPGPEPRDFGMPGAATLLDWLGSGHQGDPAAPAGRGEPQGGNQEHSDRTEPGDQPVETTAIRARGSPLGRCGGSPGRHLALRHDGHLHGDVVEAARFVGLVDEQLRGARRGLEAQNRSDLGLGNVSTEPVRAQQEPVADLDVDRCDLDVHGLVPTHGAQQLVASRVDLGLLRADQSDADPLGHDRVVVGQCFEPAPSEAIGAAVADPGHQRIAPAREHQRDHRGAHPLKLGIGSGAEHSLVGELDSPTETLVQWRLVLGEDASNGLDADATGRRPAPMATHTVGQHQQPVSLGIAELAAAVLVLGAGEAHIAERGELELGGRAGICRRRKLSCRIGRAV